MRTLTHSPKPGAFSRWLLMGGLATCLMAGILPAQATTASELTSAPKAEADQALEELDKNSQTTTSGTSTDTSSSAATGSERLRAFDTLFLQFRSQTDEEGNELDISPLLPSKKIFELTSRGYLVLDNIGQYRLSGLTEDEAIKRLSAEPVFANADIELSVLPVEQDDDKTLTLFGADLFDSKPSTDTASVPVSSDYVVGPGDEFIVQLYGSEDINETLVVSREGVIDVPKIGPVNVAGQTYTEVKSQLTAEVEEKLIGTRIFVTMGELRSVSVVAVGEVMAPGTYQVGGMATVVDVLTASGGINDLGSFRKILVMRNGKLISTVNLYDLLLKGKASGMVSLKSGDVIFVPAAESHVAISGQVKRPAIYEPGPGATLKDVIALAGGLTAEAYQQRVTIDRFSNSEKTVIEKDVSTYSGKNFALVDGDAVKIPAIDPDARNLVTVSGHVLQTGTYSWRDGMTVSDIIPSTGFLKEHPDLDYAVISRSHNQARGIAVMSFDLGSAISSPKSEADVALMPGDELFVFGYGVEGQRQFLLEPVIERLKNYSSMLSPAQIVNIEGGVAAPGTYPLTEGMKVSDLVTAAGGLKETAQVQIAEISRLEVHKGLRRIDHQQVYLSDILAGNTDADATLQQYDTLVIQADPRWTERYTVELSGEVRFPGVYPIARGEQLSSVIARAGGLTDMAFAEGAFLSRESIRERESAEMNSLADRLEVGLKATILERADENLRPSESQGVAGDIVSLLRNAIPPGRVVIDMPKLLKETRRGMVSDADITMLDGDTLHIPTFSQEVTVVGEVNHPTTLAYDKGMDMMDYIGQSGGLTRKTDDKLVYVVRADGSAALKKSWWRKDRIRPGDTIVVPLDVEKVRTLKSWIEASSVFANLVSPTAAAVQAAAAWKQVEVLEDANTVNVNP